MKLNEQVTIKGKNDRKRIQPAMMIRKDEIPKITQTQQPSLLPNSHLYSTIDSFSPLNLKPITSDTQMVKLSKDSLLEFRRIQGYTIVRLIESKG